MSNLTDAMRPFEGDFFSELMAAMQKGEGLPPAPIPATPPQPAPILPVQAATHRYVPKDEPVQAPLREATKDFNEMGVQFVTPEDKLLPAYANLLTVHTSGMGEYVLRFHLLATPPLGHIGNAPAVCVGAILVSEEKLDEVISILQHAKTVLNQSPPGPGEPHPVPPAPPAAPSSGGSDPGPFNNPFTNSPF